LREVFSLFLQLALGIVLPAWIVRRDEHRLSNDRLQFAWPEASFWCAVVAFGPICVPVHFWRTRRSLRGLAVGFLWLLAVMAVEVGLGHQLN
jgi:hypothetical protein